MNPSTNRRFATPRRWAAVVALVSAFLGAGAVGAASDALAMPSTSGPPRATGPRQIDAETTPKPLENIGIEDKAGATLPRDVRLTGSDGRSFALGEYLDGQRPLVLVLAYYGCPMLCSLVLNGANDALKAVPELAGKDYRYLVVSFDPNDLTEIGAKKRAAYVEAYGRNVEPLVDEQGSHPSEPRRASFEFATGSESEVRRLADTVGFRYRWDDEQQQFAHAAGLFVATPQGKLSQVLTGITFEPAKVSQALRDAGAGVSRSPLESVLLYCFQYNPHTGKYVLAAGRAMRVGAAATVLGLVGLVAFLMRADRRRRALPGPSTP
jgi:protein SCO1/2